MASGMSVPASPELAYVLAAVVVGVGATLFMDLLALALKRAFGVAPANYCLIGRWFCHMPDGTFTHASIANASPKAFECSVGWMSHYVVGVVYSLLFLALVSGSWLRQPTLLPALLFGLITVVVPFLVMQPSLGLGVAASRTPDPTRARLKSLMAHTAFGVGLYLCASALSHVLAVEN
jgi:hypothetical protein